MQEGPAATSPLRLCGIVGYNDRSNDLVYCHPRSSAGGVAKQTEATTVVFFGGDMQDFTENMKINRDCQGYLKWNLEDTARVVHSSFPESHVLVIRPARIEYKTFSCFNNFVPSNKYGAPEHTPMHFALQHLEKLLQKTSETLRTMSASDLNAAMALSEASRISSEGSESALLPQDMSWRNDLHLDRHGLILVGFSKGCVVLNQCIYEFHHLKSLTPEDKASIDVVGRIRDMYWLDGGHSGGKNTWITSAPLLETLSRLGINIHIHVTPYQIYDAQRPWIGMEEKLFGDSLRKLGAPVDRTVHFEHMSANLDMHFDLINVFRNQKLV